MRTFKKFLPQIRNALRYSYSNGPLECLNNHIKVLKRNAYGFRNFYHFKRRIMIRHGKTRNALRYSYSNGPLECLNNHIKVLKRNAYGFRNFYHFKRRIMIRHGKTILTK